MVFVRLVRAIVVAGCLISSSPLLAQSNTPRTPFDLQRRVPWTTDQIHGSPEPPDPYATELAFPKIQFFEPLSVGVVYGRDRFGVATRPGKIFTFEIRPDVDEKHLLLDLQKLTYGVAFH